MRMILRSRENCFSARGGRQQVPRLRWERQEGSGLRPLISASVRRTGLAGRERRFLISPLLRLAGESVKNSDNGAVGGYNPNSQHRHHGETEDANT